MEGRLLVGYRALLSMGVVFALWAIVGWADDWPQAAGAGFDYQAAGVGPSSFSVSANENVLWRTPLPNTGESTPIVVGGRIFVTCHTPMAADGESGRDLFGMCFDAKTGKELWRRKLPASRVTDMASGFSDNSAGSPVATETYVCFVNVGGSVSTFDHAGKLVWQKEWVPFGRHHARQQEPILFDGKVIFLRTLANDLAVEATTKKGAKPLGRDKKYWTHLHAYDLASGKLAWIAESATSVHAASLLNQLPDGTHAILTGRGGGHQPPEEPFGLSMIDAATGKTIWDLPVKGYAAHQNCVWKGDRAYVFAGMSFHAVDAKKGALLAGRLIHENVTVRRRVDGAFATQADGNLPKAKRQRPTTYHTNIRVGDYYYFRAHNAFLIGRVHLPSQKVEYLQVPAQVVRKSDGAEEVRWDSAVDNDVRNNDGFIVYQDKRAKLHGWGHVSAASPIVVGDHLYMPTMVGTVYVIRWNAATLDEKALVSVGDLGAAGKAWTLSSLAFADGKIFARTLRELICIGATGGE